MKAFQDSINRIKEAEARHKKRIANAAAAAPAAPVIAAPAPQYPAASSTTRNVPPKANETESLNRPSPPAPPYSAARRLGCENCKGPQGYCSYREKDKGCVTGLYVAGRKGNVYANEEDILQFTITYESYPDPLRYFLYFSDNIEDFKVNLDEESIKEMEFQLIDKYTDAGQGRVFDKLPYFTFFRGLEDSLENRELVLVEHEKLMKKREEERKSGKNLSSVYYKKSTTNNASSTKHKANLGSQSVGSYYGLGGRRRPSKTKRARRSKRKGTRRN